MFARGGYAVDMHAENLQNITVAAQWILTNLTNLVYTAENICLKSAQRLCGVDLFRFFPIDFNMEVKIHKKSAIRILLLQICCKGCGSASKSAGVDFLT